MADTAVGTARPRRRLPVTRLALLALAAGVAAPVAGAPGAPSPALASTDQRAAVGEFLAPIEEPGPDCPVNQDGLKDCKPAAASVVLLADGRVLYWNGLEGMENVGFNTVAEYGDVAVNDLSRVLDLRGATPTWIAPGPADARVNGPQPPSYLVPGVSNVGSDPNTNNDDALFCSDQVQLADGRILDAGGTGYYEEPQVPGTRYGVTELEGLKVSRIFDPATNTWAPSGTMHFGRWYPSLVTLPDGRVFVASGVTKLLKPVYLDNTNDTGRNVTETETYDPASGTWTYNGASADKSLPLFPRLHLLPDGKVYYDAAGQTFNPDGQAYDEALWNMDSVYDPATSTWTDLGVPGLGTLSPGFRGSGFSVMLPLRAPYTSASFLSAGGVLGVTPGTYLATATSEVNTVDTAHGDAVSTTATGDLDQPRWYSTGVVLPTGAVMAFSGANRDEVVLPGSGNPVLQAAMYDPATRTWRPMASASHGRTYHNSAILLPDGSVLVGGHAPISTGYAYPQTLPGGFSNNNRDPSFEVYKPPYMFSTQRPVIAAAPQSVGYGGAFTVTLARGEDAGDVASVVLVRDNAITHLVDGDQRNVELQVLARHGDELTVAEPPGAAVAPAGPYMLFVNRSTAQGLVPSVSRPVFVDHAMPAWVHGPTAPAPQQPPSPAPQPVPGPLLAPPTLPASLSASGTAPAWVAPAVGEVRRELAMVRLGA